ncbi:MAG: fibrobacter succinogenes major paralogous domain-containing protein [Fibromonadaceae bacterium]|jgi:uncharacterized protein (TIGR02145 family)|nr:fibrobacter succinogenes major paralogous domain-containing protein [Fibromonadaceae bacterium]
MSKFATLLFLCTSLFAQQKGTLTDTRDGKIYKTTKIGEQVWMAENLNYEAEGSKCYYNKPANCDKYGRLYNWETAMKACPSGWHLPANEEWKVLTKATGGGTAGKYLKATNGWNENGNGEDKYGFSALPGGLRGSIGGFGDVGYLGYWWSFSEYNSKYGNSSDLAYNKRMFYNLESVPYSSSGKDALFSVRCLQDTPAPPKGEAK